MTPEIPFDQTEEGIEPSPAYDVCQTDRLPADNVAFMDGLHLQFLQAFGMELATYLEIPIEATPAGADQVPMSTFLEDGAADACIISLDLAPMKGQAWVGLSADFLFRVLDILLGAPQNMAQSTPAGTRTTITEIEQHVLREFFQMLLNTLSKAWAPSGIELSLASLGSAEEVRKVVEPEATTLVLNCAVKLGESLSSFRIAMPVLAVRLAALKLEESAAGQAAGETAARSALLETVGCAMLQLEAVLAGSSIRLGDLAAMQPGQILVLTQPAGSQLECLVNGIPKYRGEWIAHGDRRGIEVDSLVEIGAKN